MDVVSKRYAKALLDALPSDKAPMGLTQLQQLSEILTVEPDARKLLMHPGVPPEHRERFIAKLAEGLELEVPVRKIFSLLVERRRLDILDDVRAAYQTLLDERLGIVRVQVTTTAALGESERARIGQRLTEATGKEIVMEVDQDPSIIGGLVVRIGSTLMDASLRQQLAACAKRLQSD